MRLGLAVLLLGVLSMAGRAAEPESVMIVAHRGASFDAPENTVAAIELAWKQRADASEFDVYLSRDGKVVVCHDKDLKRTAGLDRRVVDLTVEELAQIDVGTWKGADFAGEKVPTLEQMLATVPGDKKVYVEVKCGPEIVPELVRVLASSSIPPARTPIICFNADVIAAVKKAAPELPAYWLYGLKPDTTPEMLIERAKEIHADGLDLSAKPELTADFAARIKQAGLRLDVYTVNDPELARRMIEIGVDGITTDRPAWLREQVLGR